MKKTRRKFQKIEAGTMADVAFLLLLFFLVATVIETEQGIAVTLPPYEEGEPIKRPTNKRICDIKVNASNAIMVDQKLVPEYLFEEAVSQKAGEARQEGKQIVISLQHDRGTSYEAYINTYDAIKRSFKAQWDVLALEKWNRSFGELNKLEQKWLMKSFPLIISEAEPVDLAQVH